MSKRKKETILRQLHLKKKITVKVADLRNNIHYKLDLLEILRFHSYVKKKKKSKHISILT